jgi:hypothetical protein
MATDEFHRLSVERLADKLRGRRRVGVSILHQCPCGERVSFIGLFGSVPAWLGQWFAHKVVRADDHPAA